MLYSHVSPPPLAQLLGNSPLDSSALQRQKTCQLMAAAACVQVARNTSRPEEKVRRQANITPCLVKFSKHHHICCHSIVALMAVVYVAPGWRSDKPFSVNWMLVASFIAYLVHTLHFFLDISLGISVGACLWVLGSLPAASYRRGRFI